MSNTYKYWKKKLLENVLIKILFLQNSVSRLQPITNDEKYIYKVS
jgi:hypothetical protein